MSVSEIRSIEHKLIGIFDQLSMFYLTRLHMLQQLIFSFSAPANPPGPAHQGPVGEGALCGNPDCEPIVPHQGGGVRVQREFPPPSSVLHRCYADTYQLGLNA